MKLGVIGCGKMGTALVEGAVKAGVTKAADITGCDPFPAASIIRPMMLLPSTSSPSFST